MTIEELQKENETLKARLEKAKVVFKEQAAKEKELMAALDEAKNAAANSHTEMSGSVKSMIEDKNNQIMALTSEVDSMKIAVNDFEEANSKLVAKNQDLENMLATKAAELTASEEKFNELQEKYAASEANYNTTITKMSEQNASLIDKNKELSNTIKDNADACTKEISDLNLRIKQLEPLINENADLKKRLSSAESNVKDAVKNTKAELKKVLVSVQTLNDGLGSEFNMFA